MTDDTIVIGTPDLPKIEVMYAFISSESSGEGVCAVHTPNGSLPVVGADMERMDSMREELETIKP